MNESEGWSPLRTWGMCLETAAMAVGVVLIGMLIQPEDPFFTRNTFGWIALGPLLTGLRYGFASGFSCALLQVLMLFGCHRAGWARATDFPAQLAFGAVVVGAMSGEFRDGWARKLARSAIENDWHKRRLDEFARVYHLLRVSHEHLEQRLARGGGNLRHALALLKEKAAHMEAPGSKLEQLGDAVLQLCATYCGVQAATIHEVNGLGMVDDRPAARLGDPSPPRPEEPLMAQALSSGEVITLKEQPDPGALMAAVPLIDVRGRVLGIIAVYRMDFPAIQADTFRTLAVLGAYVGDLLACAPEPGMRSGDSFRRALQRSLGDLRRHGLAASLVTITCQDERGIPGLKKLAVHKRSLDEQWLTRNDRGEQVLLLLLPLTDEAGAIGCRNRMEKLLDPTTPYTLHSETLRVSDRIEDVLERVVGRIHVEDIQKPGVIGPGNRVVELEHTPPRH